MLPTLHRGDRVLVNKWSYGLHDVHRGDVVVFSRPPEVTDTTIDDLIKRVVGLPGEHVTITGGHVRDRRPGRSTSPTCRPAPAPTPSARSPARPRTRA